MPVSAREATRSGFCINLDRGSKDRGCRLLYLDRKAHRSNVIVISGNINEINMICCHNGMMAPLTLLSVDQLSDQLSLSLLSPRTNQTEL